MDDIYGDLENYNDVNAFEELRGENNDLKKKLNDYALKYAMLQENFDQLAVDFKKLEMNYSSLLKTARDEVARKTQIIATLNSEKDMIILSAIQNSNRSIHVIRKNIRDKSRRDEMDPRSVKKEKPEIKRYDSGLGLANRERIQEKRLPSTDTVSSGNTDETTAIENKLKKLASYDIEDSKENIAKIKKAQSLKHRRKSMPVLSKQPAKFSSDDDNCLTEEQQREWPPRDDKSRKTFDRHKPSHKISETSGIDEKYSSYHESSRETYYKGKSHKYTDKYRNLRDKYESRHKRHYSPEKRRRDARECPAESYQRTEFPRYRVLESPPVERYDPQRRFRDRRAIIERNDSQDARPRQESNLHRLKKLGKHKSTSDYDEPCSKRARTNSCTQSTEENIGWLKNNPVIEERLAPEFVGHLHNISCQSPDYLHYDVVSVQPKEIMTTAATKLEDPRLQSKRYVKKNDGGKTVLKTVSGRDTDLKLINTSTWSIKRMEVPEALREPPDYKDQSAQNLYNLDNPVTNMSTESGEIHSESNDMNMTDYVTESFFQDYENERINQENAKGNRYILEEPKDVISSKVKSQRDNHAPIEAERRLPPVRYKLPRPIQAESESPNPLGLLLEQMKDKCGVSTAKAHDTKLNVDQTFGESPLKDDAKDKHIDETKPARQIKSRRKTSAKELVAQDLELSDETSDNFVVKKPNEKKDTLEPTNHEKIQEIEVPKENQSRKTKIVEDYNKNTEITPFTKDAVAFTLQSKSAKKTKNKPSKQKSISPKDTNKQEIENSAKKTSDKPGVEKVRKKTNNKQEVEMVQKKTNNKQEVEMVQKKISDKPEELRIQKKISVKPEVEMVQNKTSDKLEVKMAQKKTSGKPEVEKVLKKTSVKTELEMVQKKNSNKPEIEMVQKKTFNKPEVEMVQKNDQLEILKVQKKICDKPEVEKLQKKKNEKPEVEKAPQKNSTKQDKEKSKKKTTKSMDTNDHDKKSKFSELFGDSCSLITPEDLGVPIAPTESAKTYVPCIFEDAQDSVDVSEKMLKEANPAPITISRPTDDQFNLDIVKEKLQPDITSTEIERKENNVVVSIPIKITPSMDISQFITKEPVSTVIISTGVQPGINSNSRIKFNNDGHEKPQEFNIPDGPVALATSTPFKRLLGMEVESCNSSEMGSKKDDTTSSVNQCYLSNVDPQSDDVPDVRIFVRRRRRVKKLQ